MANNRSVRLRWEFMPSGFSDDVDLFRAKFQRENHKLTYEQAVVKLAKIGLESLKRKEVTKSPKSK